MSPPVSWSTLSFFEPLTCPERHIIFASLLVHKLAGLAAARLRSCYKTLHQLLLQQQSRSSVIMRVVSCPECSQDAVAKINLHSSRRSVDVWHLRISLWLIHQTEKRVRLSAARVPLWKFHQVNEYYEWVISPTHFLRRSRKKGRPWWRRRWRPSSWLCWSPDAKSALMRQSYFFILFSRPH